MISSPRDSSGASAIAAVSDCGIHPSPNLQCLYQTGVTCVHRTLSRAEVKNNREDSTSLKRRLPFLEHNQKVGSGLHYANLQPYVAFSVLVLIKRLYGVCVREEAGIELFFELHHVRAPSLVPHEVAGISHQEFGIHNVSPSSELNKRTIAALGHSENLPSRGSHLAEAISR